MVVLRSIVGDRGILELQTEGVARRVAMTFKWAPFLFWPGKFGFPPPGVKLVIVVDVRISTDLVEYITPLQTKYPEVLIFFDLKNPASRFNGQ